MAANEHPPVGGGLRHLGTNSRYDQKALDDYAALLALLEAEERRLGQPMEVFVAEVIDRFPPRAEVPAFNAGLAELVVRRQAEGGSSPPRAHVAGGRPRLFRDRLHRRKTPQRSRLPKDGPRLV